VKRYEVLLTEDAQRDIEELHGFIAETDSLAAADHLLDRLVQLAENLASFPERGAFPQELKALGMRDFRQVLFKPYRVVYRMYARCVYIYLVADGRRNMQTLLARRLLGG
jgi:toxin ParE1/3/4